MKLLLCLLLLFSNQIFAGTKDYIVGSGSEFKFTQPTGEHFSLSIYFSESSFTKLGVEYYFNTGGILGIQVWQQFIMGINNSGLSLEEGFVLAADMKAPERMSKEFINNNVKGVKVDDFFFSKESDIDKFKVGNETVEVAAGSIHATHYRKKRDEQTVDFWISDTAGAIGLVKLISKGISDKNQNYSIELVSLLKNVKPKIVPKNAIPLTDKGRLFLSPIGK